MKSSTLDCSIPCSHCSWICSMVSRQVLWWASKMELATKVLTCSTPGKVVESTKVPLQNESFCSPGVSGRPSTPCSCLMAIVCGRPPWETWLTLPGCPAPAPFSPGTKVNNKKATQEHQSKV